MSEFVETLWREFAVETEEHLHLIEPILAGVGHDAVSATDVDQLFRSFHSLKGLARAMDLRGTENIAHQAENILGLVRDGRAPLDSDIAGLLLQAVDALSAGRDFAIANRADGPAPDALLSVLAKVFEKLGGPEGAGAGAGAPAAKPPADDDFGPDPELLGFYVEGMADNLPVLAALLSADLGDRRAEVADAIEVLAHGADMLELGPLAEAFAGLAAVLPDAGALDAAGRATATDLLGQIRDQAEILAEITGVDAGVAPLAAALTAPLEDDLPQSLDACLGTLDDLLADVDAGTPVHRNLDGLWAETERLGRDLDNVAAPLAASLLLLVSDVLRRAAREEVEVSPALLRSARDMLRAARERALGTDLDAAWCESRRQHLREILAGKEEDHVRQAWKIIDALPIRPELKEILLPQQLEQIATALSEGAYLYAVTVFPNRDGEIGGRFVLWLQKDVRAVSNRTVFEDDESGFEFLFTSDREPRPIKEALDALDPAGRCVVEASYIGVDSEQRLLPDESRQAAAQVGQGDGAGAGSGAGGGNEAVLRVRASTVQSLINEVGEMITAMAALHGLVTSPQIDEALAGLLANAKRCDAETGTDIRRLVHALSDGRRAVSGVGIDLQGGLRRLQDTALELRVVPLDQLFNRLSRGIRDLAGQQGKQVRMVLEGREVRIDKTIVESLSDPMLHMARNSVDHGIEPPEDRVAAGKPERALVRISAIHRGSEVRIEVADDGRGLNAERIRATAIKRGIVSEADAAALSDADAARLIFRPGFSTVEQVTETSGRGVGMDVVLTAVQRLGGDIDIRTRAGQGTTFILRLPVSAALQTAVIVEAGGQSMAIPDRSVQEVLQATAADVREIGGRHCITLRGTPVAVFPLGGLLGRPGLWGDPSASARLPLVVVDSGGDRIALQVERLHGRRELYLKDLHPALGAIPGVGGASIQGDGTVMLVLDAEGLVRLARASHAGAGVAGT